MSSNDPIVIAAARRTPIGSFQGGLSGAQAPQLGSAAIQAVMEDAKLGSTDVSEVIFGCVLPAGLGQAPARQASLGAGIDKGTGCTTINKVCGSGMKAAMMGHDLIAAGSADVIVVGGMESMTNAPYLLPKARGGMRMGHQEVIDHMFFDGLQNPYDGQMMGGFGETCADKYNFTREAQDEFAIESVKLAQTAVEKGFFNDEITPVTIKGRKGDTVVDTDEEPGKCNVDKIPSMRAAFKKDGTVTAATSSSISDGASALVMMRASEAEKRGLQPLAKIVGHAGHAQEPEWFTTAPVGAIKNLQEKLGWSVDDVDLYEVNEAFAVVAMAAMHDVGIPRDRLNINGGACALGHPIGATGARIITTLLHNLKRTGGKRGVASLCIGGGEATAIAVERV
ncbi:acetyl-CoA C-acetyltransferase [Natronospira proteinivora]|uniref:Acetyl-CoA C-acetyltransferase n=1 Tax=Natronospira proteinivora TaxID=1807133 RepID=A0ABT1G4W3_9GAMM|nr:acetyl-CoA C-acyltransferase [Natronospira proteinivora]MCP1726132.1 acetyl-CoA C-acetyltransferase [Natronospira proteinivora]